MWYREVLINDRYVLDRKTGSYSDGRCSQRSRVDHATGRSVQTLKLGYVRIRQQHVRRNYGKDGCGEQHPVAQQHDPGVQRCAHRQQYAHVAEHAQQQHRGRLIHAVWLGTKRGDGR